MKTFSLRLSLLLSFVFILSSLSNAQVVGGREPGQEMPHAEEPHQLNGGNYSGSVNFFNGTYQGSYPLGSVSTTAGLSFDLSLNYSSTFTGGSNFQISGGIPYGEGWNLSVPHITIESDEYHQYQQHQIDSILLLHSGSTPQTISLNENEGDLYWHSVNVNIPGRLNCRAVFKYTDTLNRKVFIPHDFEEYAEIILENDRWIVTLSDGTVYRFNIIQEGVRAAANDRGAMQYGDSETFMQTKLKNQITPKVEVLKWYCNEISNPNIPNQKIALIYDRYGEFDYFKEFEQKGIFERYKQIYGAGIVPNLSIYKDVLLREVAAYDPFATGDRLVLEYKTHDATNSQNLLLIGDDGVERKDSLYNYKTVYLRGASPSSNHDSNSDLATSFNGWKRYLHAAHDRSPIPMGADQNLVYPSINAVNPYKTKNGSSPGFKYLREEITSGSSIDFDHGYLESDRLFATEQLIPGETYEIKTVVSTAGKIMNIDINLATGRFHPIPPPSSGSSINIIDEGYIDGQGLGTTGGPLGDGNMEESIFSTFSSAVKWNTAGDRLLGSLNSIETSNFFTMQNLPHDYNGFSIQVGPANSDHIYNLRELEVKPPAGLPQERSAFYSYDDQHNSRQRAHFQRISNNFGLGMPWYMARTLYQTIGSNAIDETAGDYWFWFNTNRPGDPGNDSRHTWENEPTLSKNAQLNEVELIRYSKNPYMLTSVKKYTASGEFDPGNPYTMNLSSQLDLEYEVKKESAFDTRDYSHGDFLQPHPSKKKNYFLLKAIENVPTDPTGTALSGITSVSPTTHFQYSIHQNSIYDEERFHAVPFYLLAKVTNALGRERIITYNTLESDTTGTKKKYKLSVKERDNYTTRTPEEAIQTTFRVNRIKERISDSEFRTWDYVYNLQTAFAPKSYLNADTDVNGVFFDRGGDIPNTGFTSTTVYEPEDINGNRNYTVYKHFAAGGFGTTTRFVGGQIKSITKYNFDNTPFEKREFFYESALAYENGFLRPANEHEDFLFDYIDYFVDERTTNVEPSAFHNAHDNADINLIASRYAEFKSMEQAYSSQINDEYENSFFVKKVKEEHTIYDPDGCTALGGTTGNPTGGLVDNSDTYPNGVVNGVQTPENSTLASDIAEAESYEGASEIIAENSPLADDIIIQVLDNPNFHEELGIVEGAEELRSSLETFFAMQGDLSDNVMLHLLNTPVHQLATTFKFYELVFTPEINEAVYTAMLNNANYLDHSRLQTLLSSHNTHTDDILFQVINQNPSFTKSFIRGVMESQVSLSDSILLELLDEEFNFGGTRIQSVFLNQPNYLSENVLNELITVGSANFPENTMQILQASETALPNSVMQAVTTNASSFSTADVDQLQYLQQHAPSATAQCDPSSVTTTQLSVTNVTEYDYYEANHKGLSTSKGYIDLFGSDGNSVWLKYEPSWQPYSVKTYSLEYPNAFNEQKSYYYYDLKNRYDRYDVEYPSLIEWDSQTTDEFSFDSLTFTGTNPTDVFISLLNVTGSSGANYPEINPDGLDRSQKHRIRTIPYQTTTTKQNGESGKAFVKSDYFVYDSRWGGPIQYYYSLEQRDTQRDSVCPFDTTNYCKFNPYDKDNIRISRSIGGLSFVYDTTYLNVPNAYPQWIVRVGNHPSNYQYFSHRISCGSNGYGQDTVVVFDPRIPPTPHNPDSNGGSGEFVNLAWNLNEAMMLSATHTQIDTINIGASIPFNGYPSSHAVVFGNTDLMHFRNDGKFISNLQATGGVVEYTHDHFTPIMPYENLTTSKVLKRNIFTLPTLVEDVQGIQTRFVFDSLKRIQQFDTICQTRMNDHLSIGNRNMPSSVIVGSGRFDSTTTNFTYYPNLSLKTSTDADYNVEMAYRYDDLGRRREDRRDGELINTYKYNYWNSDFNQSFSDRTLENYVEQVHYPNDSNQTAVITKEYKDPLGRTFQALTGELANGVNSSQVSFAEMTGRSTFDQRDRVTEQFKAFGYDKGGSLFDLEPKEKANGTNLFTYPYIAEYFEYEHEWEGRILGAAKYGETLASKKVSNSYQLMNSHCFACDLELSNLEMSLIMPDGITSNYIFSKTSTTDEDGKITDVYSNAIGQTVATRQFDTNGEFVTTLSAYDKQGNLTTVINPNNQRNDYRYNLMGWMYEQETTDGGITQYRYDERGNVVMMQDEKGRQGRIYDPMETYDTEGTYPYVCVYSFDDYGRPIEKGEAYIRNNLGFLGVPTDGNSVTGNSSQGGHTYEIEPFSHKSTYSWTDKASMTFSSNQGAFGVPYGDNTTAFIPTDPVVYFQGSGLSRNIDPLHFVSHVFLNNKWVYVHGDASANFSAAQSAIVNSLNNRVDKLPHRLDHVITYNELWKDKQNRMNDDRMIEVSYFDYTKYGEIASLYKKFNQYGIRTTLQPEFISKQSYSDYNNDNIWSTHETDIFADDTLDMQCYRVIDARGRVEEVYANYADEKANGNKVVSYEYDDVYGRVTRKFNYFKLPSGAHANHSTQYAYDVRDRLTQIDNFALKYNLYYDNQQASFNGHTPSGDLNYNGNINGIKIDYTLGSLSNYATGDLFDEPTVYNYEYDDLNRLAKSDAAVFDFTEGTNAAHNSYKFGDANFAYDKVGNLTALQRWINVENGQQNWTYKYMGHTNRLTSLKGTDTPNRSYTYDASGNLLSDDSRDITDINYTSGNLPITIFKTIANNPNPLTNPFTNYYYDSNGNRIYKHNDDYEADLVGTSLDAYYYLRNAEGVSIAEYNETSKQWDFYVHGNEREARIQPWQTEQPNFRTGPSSAGTTHYQTDFYVYDHLGNTRVSLKYKWEENQLNTSLNGAYDYFPYGKQLRKYVPGNGDERYLTTQHERDAETIAENKDGTGLDNRGARFYDSDVARFLSLDPAAIEYPSWSDYNYVMGNPIVLVDPDGRRVDWYTPNDDPTAKPVWFEGSDEHEGYTWRGEYHYWDNWFKPGEWKYWSVGGRGSQLDDFKHKLYNWEKSLWGMDDGALDDTDPGDNDGEMGRETEDSETYTPEDKSQYRTRESSLIEEKEQVKKTLVDTLYDKFMHTNKKPEVVKVRERTIYSNDSVLYRDITKEVLK